ncbi:MAG: hypothetical protein Q8S47_14110 [Phenylobacterium sp.]|nr:hypothetical protein [Phenylobacterium sp.]
MKRRNLTTLSIGALAAVTLAACGDNEVETTEPMPAETGAMGAMTPADPMVPTGPAMADPAMPANGMTPPPVNDPAAMDPAATSPATEPPPAP